MGGPNIFSLSHHLNPCDLHSSSDAQAPTSRSPKASRGSHLRFTYKPQLHTHGVDARSLRHNPCLLLKDISKVDRDLARGRESILHWHGRAFRDQTRFPWSRSVQLRVLTSDSWTQGLCPDPPLSLSLQTTTKPYPLMSKVISMPTMQRAWVGLFRDRLSVL